MNPPLVSISPENVDKAMWHIQMDLMRRHGLSYDRAAQIIGPLHWYVSTGRASVDFLHGLIIAKPYLISRRLMSGGSDQEIIDKIKKCIGCKE